MVEYINGFALGYSVAAEKVPDSDYHCENDYEIMYVRRGKRRTFVKESAYNLSAGQLLFIDKNTLHKTSYLTDEYERFVINFSEYYILKSVQENMCILFEQRLYVPTKLNHIDKLFVAIFAEWEKLRDGDNIAVDNIKCYINILLTLFIRNHKEYAYDDAKIDNPSIERLVEYMNENFKYQITLKSASQMLRLSPSHLSRIFLKYTGFGFLEYLNIIRIENGKQMLVNTDMSVKQIAFECGFNDSNYFSSVFKTQAGISPLQYRKKNASIT